MVRSVCSDYGFECTFIAEDHIEQAMEKFGKRTLDKYGIKYIKKVLAHFILRQRSTITAITEEVTVE